MLTHWRYIVGISDASAALFSLDNNNEKTKMSLLPLIIAIVANFSMGSFYAWSVLVVPLEESIGATRSDISLAYSITFVSMTVGMFITHSLLRVASLPYLLFIFLLLPGWAWPYADISKPCGASFWAMASYLVSPLE